MGVRLFVLLLVCLPAIVQTQTALPSDINPVTLSRLLGPLAIDGGTVQREVFAEAFPQVIEELELGSALYRKSTKNPNTTFFPPNTNPPVFQPPIQTISVMTPRTNAVSAAWLIVGG